MLLLFVLPVVLAIGAVAGYADDAAQWLQGLTGRELPQAPAWLGRIPLLGERLTEAWQRFAGQEFEELAGQIEPYLRDVARWLVGEARTVGLLLVQTLLIVILSAVLYSGGEGWGAWVVLFGRRLAADRGEASVILAGRAIRGVALGVIVTAIIQSALGSLGLIVAGVPFAGLLTALMFMLCVAQLGPLLVLLPATAWLYVTGHEGWGTFLLVWSLLVGVMDNFIKPVLIRRGADLPLLLIFAGVIGGLLSFGLLGIFVGPVVLAVTYTLVDAWVREARAPAERGSA
jgi:predicted PurR-regulated permease PerM